MFRGIPYAEPPVGDLRFAAPQPGRGWEGCVRRSPTARRPRSPARSGRPRRAPATTGGRAYLYELTWPAPGLGGGLGA
ncbi:carboxylesterase family protein [Micromonospora haikouensis]|uniref:carboxylesterase family protein n=1 Tax=Micromonospora haikouensis TaxID=686309 RepID=UPI003D9258FF